MTEKIDLNDLLNSLKQIKMQIKDVNGKYWPVLYNNGNGCCCWLRTIPPMASGIFIRREEINA